MPSLSQDSGAEIARPSRLWRLMHSSYVLGGGYALAVTLTAVGILLAAFPPATGPLGPASNFILTVLGVNLALVLCLLGVMAFRFMALRIAQSQDAAARLHLRFVTLFAAAAVAPALVVFLFYGVLVSRGVEEWFSQRVRTVVEGSATVARAYVKEQTTYLETHVPTMAVRLEGGATALRANPVSFSHYVAEQAADSDFPAAGPTPLTRVTGENRKKRESCLMGGMIEDKMKNDKRELRPLLRFVDLG